MVFRADGDGGSAPTTKATSPAATSKDTTPTKPPVLLKGGSRPTGTAFNKLPLRDPITHGLIEATRRNWAEPKTQKREQQSFASPDAADSKGHPRGPAQDSASDDSPKSLVSPDAADTNREGRDRAKAQGKPVTNDGEAQFLVEGKNVGNRDAAIAELKKKHGELTAERADIRDDIEDIKTEIKDEKGTAGTVGTVVDVATAPVAAIAGLFGHSNPVSDVAKGVTENLMGLNEDKETLEKRQTELDNQTKQIESKIKQLDDERVLNFLAATAHTTGMDDKVANFIEDGEIDVKGKLHVKLKVAESTGTGSDGVFDSGTNDITIDSELMQDAGKDLDSLVKQGVADADGNIIDAKAFDKSAEGDNAIKTVSTMAVHEVNHATQQADGEFEPAFRLKQDIVRKAIESLPADASPDEAKRVLKDAMAEGERVRTAAVEVPSYLLQEQNDLRSGAKKKAFITIDEHGEALPFQQQVDNVLAYVQGKPLVHGPTTGYVRSTASDDPADDHDSDVAGQGRYPGNFPGITGRLQLPRLFHGSFLAAADDGDGFKGPSDTGDGFKGPGDTGGGFKGPTWTARAYEAAGLHADGFKGPGDTGDGFKGPTWLARAYAAAGMDADGFKGPGDEGDGFKGPSDTGDGFKGPGDTGGGFKGPTWLAQAYAAAGIDAEGFKGPGDTGDGFKGPGDKGDGFKGPTWLAQAFAAAGYDADGFKGPGFKGPTWLAQAFEAFGITAEGFKGPGDEGDGFKGPGDKG